MTSLRIEPGKLKGNVKIPPSKSMAHRAVICAALSDGISRISNVEFSDDIIATINAMRALGAVINEEGDYLEVKGVNFKNTVPTREFERVVDCNESGSTLRFLIPISLVFEGITRFIGRGNLGKRPLDTYYNIFDEQNIEYHYKEEELDLLISGMLKPGVFKVRGDISSQFITGLLFALPLLDGDSKIVITTEFESKGYIDLTLSAMKDFGIEIINKDYKEFIIKGNQKYAARDYRVEGDYSQGAFFLVADALGSDIKVLDLKEESLQGDREVIDILARMGMQIKREGNTVSGEIEGQLKAAVIDGSQCPDIIPVLALAAALSDGKTEIINSERLRIKECDRLSAVTSELNKLGAKIEEKKDGLVIEGVKEFKGNVEVWSHKDHRIAMTLAVASTMCKEPITLKDYECVSKSYPNFFKDFKQLGGTFDECSLGK